MKLLVVTCLAVGRILAAPPLEKLRDISEEQTVTSTEPTTTITTEDPKTANTTDISENEITGPIRLTGKERESLIGYIDLETSQNLVLTPREQIALTKELEYQELGLQPFSDPTPWQRLTREEQQTFNNVYLALPEYIQEFSRIQFQTVPDDIQEHAFRMFLNLDIETLIYVIGKELQNEELIGQQIIKEPKQHTEDTLSLITNEKTLEEEHVVEKNQEISSGEQEEVEENEKLGNEDKLRTKEENEDMEELEVEEDLNKKEEPTEELEQTANEDQDIKEDKFEEDEYDKEKMKEIVEIKKEEIPLYENVDLAIKETSTQSNEHNLVTNKITIKEVAIERLNQEIADSPDFSLEELGVPFLPRRQEAKRKNNNQYQARKKFVEKRKQILTEQPRGPLRDNAKRRQSLTKQSRGALRINIERRARLPQRRINLIDPRNKRGRS